jgi:hypothetical protein
MSRGLGKQVVQVPVRSGKAADEVGARGLGKQVVQVPVQSGKAADEVGAERSEVPL